MSADTLSLRLEVLERGIQDVQTALEHGSEIPAALRDARNTAERARWFIDDVDERLAKKAVLSAIGAVKSFLEKIEHRQSVLEYLEHQRITVETTRWIEALSSVGEELRKCGERGLTLSQQLDELITELSPIEKRVVKFDKKFRDRIGVKIDELADEIRNMRDSLRTEKASLNDMWGTYFTSIEPKAQRLFIEYLGLLGGVSIRERALAKTALAYECQLDELCALADYHFTSELTMCVDVDAEITAVPGSGAAGDVPVWPILRLGLASWSIWGLPLIGYEFGKLVAEKRLNDEAGTHVWNDERLMFGETGLRTLIADTIGAWTEGPAYACALLFLVLNPAAGPDKMVNGGITEAERAQVVLAVLDRQAGPRAADGQQRQAAGYEYVPFLHLLSSNWGIEAEAGDGPTSADDSAMREREALLTRLPGSVIERFRLKKPFALDDWQRSQDVLKHLATDATNPLPKELAVGVRHLTNAAWRGRLSPKPAGETEELARRAMAEGLHLVNPERERFRTMGTDPLKARSAGL